MAASASFAATALPPPSRFLLFAEIRALGELALGIGTLPLLAAAPRGDGHSVLVLPGFLASDRSTELLRRYLRALGHNAVGWNQGRNLGGVYRMRPLLQDRVKALADKSGRKVSVVGWSLGGVYARDLALNMTENVRSITTLGSPFTRDFRANNVGRLYDTLSGEPLEHAVPADIEALMGDMPVPATSIFSRTDGVVHWRTSQVRVRHDAENIEVIGASHIGLGANPAVLWAVADRLAQKEGQFIPFGRRGPFWAAYGKK